MHNIPMNSEHCHRRLSFQYLQHDDKWLPFPMYEHFVDDTCMYGNVGVGVHLPAMAS